MSSIDGFSFPGRASLILVAKPESLAEMTFENTEQTEITEQTENPKKLFVCSVYSVCSVISCSYSPDLPNSPAGSRERHSQGYLLLIFELSAF
jgi:hypothetical protein